MSFVAVAIGGSALLGLGGAMISSNAAGNAAQTQAAASNYATNAQTQEFNTQFAAEQPWLQAGQSALPQLQSMAATAPTFTQQDFLNNQDPAYQFDMQQGLNAVQRSAAASGSLQSGGTLKSINDYAQGMASNEYQNAYNRFMTSQNTQFNRLASLAGIGQTANSAIGQAGQSMANNIGNIATSNANAQGAATIAQGNAWSGALSGIGNAGMQGLMLSKLGSGYPGGYPGGGGGVPYNPDTDPYMQAVNQPIKLLPGS